MQFYAAIALVLLFATAGLPAAESPHLSKAGLKNIQLVTDVNEIQPGKTLTVGLLIEPESGFHTYWKGPGVVGVATNIEWTLPENFEAGPILWPPPEKTLMAGIAANGYRSEEILLTDIVVPENIEGDDVTIHAKVAWMACSTSCHPGIQELEITLPVNRSKAEPAIDEKIASAFTAVRNSIPPPAPKSWNYTLERPEEDTIRLSVQIPEFAEASTKGIEFFSYDHQVDSDAKQKVTRENDGRFVLELPRPDFAPPSPEALAGLLFHPDGWPGIDSKWAEISVPWPEGSFADE